MLNRVELERNADHGTRERTEKREDVEDYQLRRGSAAGRASMRRNTAWAFAGNSVYAGCQWVVFVLLVRRSRSRKPVRLRMRRRSRFDLRPRQRAPESVAGDRYRIARRLFGLFERTPADDSCSGLDIARHRGCSLPAGGIVQRAGHHGDGQGV